MARPLFVALAVAAALIPAGIRAQSPRERTIYVSVLDKKGEPVPGLTAADFTVKEARATREVLRVSPADGSLDVAVLVDTSASITPAVPQVRDGLGRFTGALFNGSQGGNHVSLIGLGLHPTTITKYTDNLDELKAGIDKISPYPGTGMVLTDALFQTTRQMETRIAPRVAVVAVLSDGPETGDYNGEAVIKGLKRAGAQFHAVTIGKFAETNPDPIITQRSQTRFEILTRGTKETGGSHQSLVSPSGVPLAFERLGRQLVSQYKIVYGGSQAAGDPPPIEVTVGRSGLTARVARARWQ